MKKVIILLFLVIFIAGCGSQSLTNVTQGGQSPSAENQPGVTSSQPSTSSASIQVSKYAKFEAQTACDEMTNEDLVGLEARSEGYARQAGFTGLADAQAYGKSVPDQEALKRQIMTEMSAICPDFVNKLNNMGK